MIRFIEPALYSAGIALYAGGVRIAALSNPKAKLMSEGHERIFSVLKDNISPSERYIWFHAASLGEFEQGRPLMERLRVIHPDLKIILTFFSPSGYEVRKNYEGADVICYLPFDTPGNVRKFLDIVNPEVAVFIKYEIWRNYLHELTRRKIPTYLVSAIFRPNQIFFKPLGKQYRKWLHLFDKIFVQDERSRRLLSGIGYEKAVISGDTRFDRVLEISEAKKEIPELRNFTEGAKMVMMAGSSWEKDEEIYIPWINKHPEVKLVIAPHEFDEERLQKLRNRFIHGAVLFSEARSNADCLRDSQVLIIDCFGLLSSAYTYCDVAYIGGAFGAGLHNINEAAVYGVPVVFGPKFDKFLEAVELTELGGATSIASREEFEAFANKMLNNPGERKKAGEIACNYIRRKAGASEIILNDILQKIRKLH